MLVLNLPFKALMFLTLMRPSLVLFLVLWLKLVKDFLKVRCRLALLRSEERFSRNAETDIVCRLLLEKKKAIAHVNMSTTQGTLGINSFTKVLSQPAYTFCVCFSRST